MKFKVISFYADVDGSTFYSDCAKEMLFKCNELNIDHYIKPLKTQNNYFKNTLLKPKFILDCLKKFKMPVLWVDVDSKILNEPILGDEWSEVDFSGINRPTFNDKLNNEKYKQNIFVSPLFFNYTKKSIEILERWVENAVFEKYDEGDHEILLDIMLDFDYEIKEFLPQTFSYNLSWITQDSKSRKFWNNLKKSDSCIETVIAPSRIIKSKRYKKQNIKKNRTLLDIEKETPDLEKLNKNRTQNIKTVEKKIKINIFDKNFANSQPCSAFGKESTYIDYVKNKRNFDGITFFTDHCFHEVVNTKSKVKIAWQVESPWLSDKQFYPMLKKYINEFDYIFTYDEKLIKRDPNKFLRVNFGGTTVIEPQVFPKNKSVCMVHSGKSATANHRLRQQIIEKYPTIDVYGGVTGTRFKHIENVYSDYRFVIVVENGNYNNYFSEKITDAFACRCIPIYHGCHNIDDTFDTNGIIKFNTLANLNRILPTLNYSLYNGKMNAVENNFNKTINEFNTTEDWLYENYLKDIIKKHGL